MPEISDYNFFRKWVIITLFAVYILIFLGGVVRSTGSGMGCPDWPKCFGRWVPPTNTNEIPGNYKEFYSAKRKLKNEKIASYLRMLNFNQLASKISNDKSIYDESDFNALKTWIEYLNRVAGVLVGLFIIVVCILSFKFYFQTPQIFYLSLLSLITVGLEGWLGSIVVSTNLLPFSITLHMTLALFLIGLLIYLLKISKQSNLEEKNFNYTPLKFLIAFATLVTFVQILLGTQVRESIDIINIRYNNSFRNIWISELGNTFFIHRTFSIFILLLNFTIIYLLLKSAFKSQFLLASIYLFSSLIIEIGLGVIMAYLSIPAFSQPLHLLFGSIILGIQLFLYFHISNSSKIKFSNI